jgi:hypothetical protein
LDRPTLLFSTLQKVVARIFSLGEILLQQ